MRLLSVVGLKTLNGQRATLVQTPYSSPLRIKKFSRSARWGVFLSCVFGLIFLQLKEKPWALHLQESAVTLLSPLSNMMNQPYKWAVNGWELFQRHSDLRAENVRLKLQNDYLIRQNQTHRHIYSENSTLKEALKVRSIVTEDIITARVTHHVYDGYSATYYLGATLKDGVKKNDPVLTTKGYLIGRLISVGQKNARFMPITDVSSRVPVKVGASKVGTSNDHAILRGTGKGDFILSHIENIASLKVGEELVTSGVGGVFAPCIPVAVITSIEGDKVKATPLGGLKDLDFVLVLSQFQDEP